jgi:hypothetical protein
MTTTSILESFGFLGAEAAAFSGGVNCPWPTRTSAFPGLGPPAASRLLIFQA